MKTGIELIAEERQRQIEAEGWTPEHDDSYQKGELVHAAACYAELEACRQSAPYFHEKRINIPPPDWPFAREWWKPIDSSPIRNLIKAGALIAAEIDRIKRSEKTSA